MLLSLFLKIKAMHLALRITGICTISLTGYLISNSSFLPPYFQYVFSFILVLVYTLFWDGSLFQKTLASLFTIGIMTLLNALLTTLEAGFFTLQALNIHFQYTVILFNESVALLFAWLLRSIVPRKLQQSHLNRTQMLIALFYPCVASVTLFTIAKILQGEKNILLSFLALFLFVALLFHLVLTEMLNSRNERDLKLSLLSQQVRAESEKADALLEAYTVQRRLSHEFDNHISALSAYLHSQQYVQAEEYIQQISTIHAEKSLIVNTHNPPVDAILSQKYALAIKQGLTVSFDLCDLSSIPVSTPDLVILLSNLFTNAIEGSHGKENGQINIRIHNTYHEFLISVRNQVEKEVSIVNNAPPLSTKKEPGHGMGLQNVVEICNKYKANHLICCQAGWFQVTILINKATENNNSPSYYDKVCSADIQSRIQ